MQFQFLPTVTAWVELCTRQSGALGIDYLTEVAFQVTNLSIVLSVIDLLSSFPGGKKDDSDNNIIDTALREAEEEIGLAGSDIQVWGPLLPVPSRVSGIWALDANVEATACFYSYVLILNAEIVLWKKHTN